MTLKKLSPGHKKIWIAIGIVIIAGLTVAGLALSGVFKSNDQKTQEQTQKQNSDKKEEVINNQGTPVTDGSKGSATTASPYTPPTNNSGIVITPSMSGSNVIISTKLTGYSDGNCSLTVTNGAQTTTQSAQVIYAPNYSTCAGFTIPKATLGAGNWSITLSITSNGSTTSKETTYTVTM